jgi:hypothetical protein
MTKNSPISVREFDLLRGAMYTWAELLEVNYMLDPANALSTDFSVTVKYGIPPRHALDVMCGIAPALVERFGTTDLDKLLLVPFSEVEKALPAYHPVLQAAFRDHAAFRCLYDVGVQFDARPVLRPLPDTREVRDIVVRVAYPMPSPLPPSLVVHVKESSP